MFSSIGAFSAATPELSTEDLLLRYPSLSGPEPAANKLKHLWIPVGDKDESTVKKNDFFVEQLRTAGVKHEYFKTFNAGILDPESDISKIEELTINPSN